MSTKPQGLISLKALQQLAADNVVDTVATVFTDLYGRLLGKRLDIDFFLENYEHGIGACTYLLSTDMPMNTLDDFEFSNWQTGNGDMLLLPDLNTLRIADWLDSTVIVICDVIDEHTRELVPIAPRSLLKAQIKRLAEHDLTAKAGSELEYYTFEKSYLENQQQNYQALEPVGLVAEDYHMLQGTREEFFHGRIRRHLKASGIPVENSKGECGPGQHELNVKYQDILTMADNHILYKQCMKEVADQLGVSVTFMAKYNRQQVGSSGHLHVSLWRDNDNAFVGEKDYSTLKASPIFANFLAGWIKYTPEMMPFFASTINSYKRYQAGSWAPTSLAWSLDNRSAGFRIVGHGPSLRIECRLPGADVNPYLAYSGALAAGIEGINKELNLPQPFNGNAYQADEKLHVPKSLAMATDAMQHSAFAQKVFGKKVLKHYITFYRYELEAFNQAVTDWELQRYFEQI